MSCGNYYKIKLRERSFSKTDYQPVRHFCLAAEKKLCVFALRKRYAFSYVGITLPCIRPYALWRISVLKGRQVKRNFLVPEMISKDYFRKFVFLCIFEYVFLGLLRVA